MEYTNSELITIAPYISSEKPMSEAEYMSIVRRKLNEAFSSIDIVSHEDYKSEECLNERVKSFFIQSGFLPEEANQIQDCKVFSRMEANGVVVNNICIKWDTENTIHNKIIEVDGVLYRLIDDGEYDNNPCDIRTCVWTNGYEDLFVFDENLKFINIDTIDYRRICHLQRHGYKNIKFNNIIVTNVGTTTLVIKSILSGSQRYMFSYTDYEELVPVSGNIMLEI